ncbi:piggyBac transposable element-derived protein 4-like [Diorhabda carinulata]|uniref:piggyBac transposable element-derived protein 4-like n=1 Tax=Diorhabda carinulata TaxID=1163345 RepID=UPI0025A16D5A|nr:piggyBac transposable element-derived protein 4-like [Diorhabda carinulata]
MNKGPVKTYSTIEEILEVMRELSDEEHEAEDNLEVIENSDDSDEDPTYDPEEEEVIEEKILEEVRKDCPHPEKKKRTTTPQITVAHGTSKLVNKYIVTPKENEFVGKNGMKWSVQTNDSKAKAPARNIVHVRPGPCKMFEPDLLQCFQTFFSKSIIDEIILRTNQEIERQRLKYKTSNSTLSNITNIELDAFFGLLILSAVLKDNHLSTDLLFNTEYSGNKYRATMSKERLNFIVNCLRFDDLDSRMERRNESKFAPIKSIWEMFISNCKSNYKPSSYCTIDEQLVGFRGRCPFRVYMSNKPNKYGIKIMMLCDNSTKYMVDAIPYLGKDSETTRGNVPGYYVEKLVETIKSSNRNLAMDNWFMSIPLAQKLLNEYKLTVIGTIRKNKRELPEEFVDIKFEKRGVNSSFFLSHDNVTIVSYKPKANKLVTLISTMHHGASLRETSCKPEMIHTYNETKGAVDTFDQMCQNMNCGRKTRRWPLCIFFNMVNLACINSYVVYAHNFYRQNNNNEKPLTRVEFMLQLHELRAKPWQLLRLTIPTISNELRLVIRQTLKLDDRSIEQQVEETKNIGKSQ